MVNQVELNFVNNLLAKATKNGQCLECHYAKDSKGYSKYRGELVHRLVWSVVKGPIPEGLFILHRCDNPSCINPAHLFIGTAADNMADCIKKGRNSYISHPGEANGRAVLTKEQVVEIRASRELGLTYIGIAINFNVSVSTVKHIVARRTWKHV